MTAAMVADYGFPCDNLVVDVAYKSLALELANALDAIGTQYFHARATDYLAARRTFRGLLKPADYRYFASWCREEGNARLLSVADIVKRLQTASVKDDHRVNFYALGAGEALLMDLGVFLSNP